MRLAGSPNRTLLQ